MRFCTKCGYETQGDEFLCPNCNEPLTDEIAALSEERSLITSVRKMMIIQRIFWFVGAVAQIFMAVFSYLISTFYETPEAMELLGFAAAEQTGLSYDFEMVIYIIGALMCLIQGIRMGKFIKLIYTDIITVRDYCQSAWMIVTSALFNTVNLILYIVNYARLRANSHVVSRIVAGQRQGIDYKENMFM